VRYFVAIALCGCVAGCIPPAVALTDTWPTAAAPYEKVYADWTRHGEFHQDYQEIIAIDATLQSPAWRFAKAARDRSYSGQSDSDFNKTIDDDKKDAEQNIRVGIVVTTWDRRENNLARGELAAWHVALSDDSGHTWTPTSIVQDRRSEHILRADYPAFRDFSSVYVATFDGKTKAFGAGAKKLTLRVYGSRGGLDVEWQSQ
jgi:hypothetical protein